MAKSKLVRANKKIAEGVVSGYKKIEKDVVGTYQKIEDKFVNHFLAHEGESATDAKKRLAKEQAVRKAKSRETVEKHATGQKAGTKACKKDNRN